MRSVINIVTAAIVVAGCGGATAATPPGATPPVTTVAPTSIPSPSGAPALPLGNPVPAGTYSIDRNPLVTVAVPAGWGTYGTQVIAKSDFAGLYYEDLSDGIVVYAKPCTWASGGQSEPRGAAAIAAALSAQQDRQASQPRDVTVGGLPAVHVRLTVPADQPFTGDADHHTFTGCDRGEFRSYTTKTGAARYHQGPSQVDDFYLVDIGGSTVLFDVMSGPDIAASDQAELQAMLASVRID